MNGLGLENSDSVRYRYAPTPPQAPEIDDGSCVVWIARIAWIDGGVQVAFVNLKPDTLSYDPYGSNSAWLSIRSL